MSTELFPIKDRGWNPDNRLGSVYLGAGTSRSLSGGLGWSRASTGTPVGIRVRPWLPRVTRLIGRLIIPNGTRTVGCTSVTHRAAVRLAFILPAPFSHRAPRSLLSGPPPCLQSCPPPIFFFVRIWTVSDSKENQWTDNPNAPKTSHHLYLGEKASFAGTVVCSILYGTLKIPHTSRT